MFEYIINHFCLDSRYINDIDGLINYLNQEGLSDEEKANILLEVYNYNLKILSKIKEENKKLKQISAVESIVVESKQLPQIENETIIVHKKLNITNIDVSNYISKIKKIDNLDELISILPDEKIENSKDIINIIILKLVEDVVDIKKMLYQERNKIDISTKEYFENEIEKLQLKIKYIRNITNSKDCEINEEKEETNDLVFLTTNRGNPCVYQDLKDIPSEQYDTFVVLLDSIINGKFTNLRTFNNNDSLRDLREVKYGQSRIIFRQLASNCYAIIYMFIKKVDKDAYYHSSIANRNDLFMQSVDEMTLLANTSEDYLEENRMILSDIYETLNSKNKVKKVGDING